MRHGGITRRVRLRNSEKDKAALEALHMSELLEKDGWPAITIRQARLPASPTIEEFLEAYTGAVPSMQRVPRPITVRLYARSLRQLCALVGVERIRDLTPDMVEKARDLYRANGKAAGRPEGGVNNTIFTLIRNAGACFKRDARSIMAKKGLVIENPFIGIVCKSDIKEVEVLPQDTMDAIWRDAPLLRDGDPDADDPNLKGYIKRYKKTHEGRQPGRWVPVDFRRPHPDAYAALLLALGAGLRANEIDKSRWSWLKTDPKGNYYIEVAAEDDFKPKGADSRKIGIPAELQDALVKTRTDLVSPYILGGAKSTTSSSQGGGFYRCPATIRAINTWLRERGVEAEDKFGKPLHALRKQFGSEVASTFGLFAAQKLLGHKSPAITAKHYAGLINLPVLTHVRIAG
jgi:hypothetical protein